MAKKIINLSLLLLVLQSSIMAQQALSYTLFIENIKANHPLIKRANAISEIGKTQLQSARGNYDPNITGNYDNKFLNGKNYYSSLHSEIKQPLFTSQYIKAGYEYGQGTNINPEDATSTYGLAYLGVEASVLQGLIIDKRRAEVLKAQQYKLINEAEKKQLINSILYEASIGYSEWLYSQRILSLQRYFAQLAVDRLNAIKQLSSVGERPAVDTTEASLLAQQRTLDYYNAILENQKQLTGIVINNWQDNKPETFSTAITSLDSMSKLTTDLTAKIQSEITNDIVNNPLIEQYNAKQALLHIEKRYHAELIKPKLDVKYNFLTTGDVSNFNAQLSPNNYKWGAALSFPLLLRTSRADLKIANLHLRNIKFELDNKQNELDKKLILAKNTIVILNDQLSTAIKMISFSKALLEAEKLKFENGESSLFLINTRETKWLESEIKLTEYQLKYAKAIFNLIYLKGNLNYSL